MVDAKELASIALRHFPIEVRRVTRAAESFNTIYRVEAVEGTYALRVGPSLQIHAAGTARAETVWQRSLVDAGLAVPDVVQTSSGEPMVLVNDADDQPRTCVLFTWIRGRSMRTRLGLSRARTLGRLMARLHGFPVGDVDVLRADKVLYWLLPDRLGDVPEHGKVLTEARDSVQALISELWRDRTPQLLHGDLTAANVIEAPGVGPVPIDFQDMVFGFAEQDISFTLASFGRRDDRDAMAQAFRDGYAEICPWPEVSDAVMRGLIVARGLHQLNLSLATAEGPLPRDYLDYHGAKAQTWLDAS
ncbi:phosphotransferase enzyme family protein [Kribbella qitaiheensis]|uniref:phosphotransferase enzyme family protein n=1 Tax=Kribbella qitaiheensis TaxID=1544730 RepID=UPI001624178C|nr:phosphotransferase [Kribbella qitaiheensis]